MKAVFFDLDGTLFDTRADLAATVNHTRRDLGLAEWPQEEVIAHVGQGARHLLERAIPERPDSFESLWNIYLSHYEEHCCERVKPYPGVLETLAELKGRGWLLGVNTNKPNFAARKILARFGVDRLVGGAVIAGGDGFALKPDPVSLVACAERLGHRLASGDWMVGDNWTDMRCAEAAGVQSVYCAYGFGYLRDAPYTAKVSRFDELLSVVDHGNCA